jgi:pimeloyl-ACP methyl ester carboxylesterase
VLAGVALLGTLLPAGAADATGDHSSRWLRDYYEQRPKWSACDFDARLECASIAVPLDYARSRGERLSIAISRIKATDPKRRRGALLSVNGGPDGKGGGLGRALPLRFAGTDVHRVYDLIGMDTRGNGASSPLSCEVTQNQTPFNSRPPDSDFTKIAVDMRRTEDACRRGSGGIREHFTTENSARDVDVIRAVLGERRLSFVGYAYGSFLGAVYGTLFGPRLDRHVLDSVRNPDWSWRQQFMAQAVAIRANVDQWASWTGQRNGRFGLGTSRAAVLATVERVAAKLAVTPVNGLTRTAFDGAMGIASSRPRWVELADLVRALDTGGTSPATKAGSVAGEVTAGAGPALRSGTLETVTCEGANGWPRDLETYYRDMRRFRDLYPYGYGVSRAQPWVCAFRTFTPPAELPQVTRSGFATGVVVQAEGDPLTHYDGGPAMARRLRDPLITVADEGSNEIFGLRGNACVDRLVTRYLVGGVLPPPRVTCVGTPRPDVMED